MDLQVLERRRCQLQNTVDAQKTKQERNQKGQFATPPKLAEEIITKVFHWISTDPKPFEKISFLEPGFNTGVFSSTLLQIHQKQKLDQDQKRIIERVVGVEVDLDYYQAAVQLWLPNQENSKQKKTEIELKREDFFQSQFKEKFNLLICNPPYVRHHHIKKEKKKALCKMSEKVFGVPVTGLTGLHCHFIAQAHSMLEKGALCCWLIPSESIDVNYGRSLKHYLLHSVDLLEIYTFDPNDVQFDNALVSSAVLFFRKGQPRIDKSILFTHGGSLTSPKTIKKVSKSSLTPSDKWLNWNASQSKDTSQSKNSTYPKLSDYFQIKRGLATGNNSFFILSENKARELDPNLDSFKPILPSPKFLKKRQIEPDEEGFPLIESRLFLLDVRNLSTAPPLVQEYLKKGVLQGVHQSYLCSNRKIWHQQEQRESSLFYCSYIGRKKKEQGEGAFTFFLNQSKAIVTNSYLILYPLPHLQAILEKDVSLSEKIYSALLNIQDQDFTQVGRQYGGGMQKLEPSELGNCPAFTLQKLIHI